MLLSLLTSMECISQPCLDNKILLKIQASSFEDVRLLFEKEGWKIKSHAALTKTKFKGYLMEVNSSTWVKEADSSTIILYTRPGKNNIVTFQTTEDCYNNLFGEYSAKQPGNILDKPDNPATTFKSDKINIGFVKSRKAKVTDYFIILYDETSFANEKYVGQNPVREPERYKREGDSTTYTKVEVEAGFNGGDFSWKAYLMKNLNADIPIQHGAPEGVYTVIVRFIVSKDGSVTEVKAETHLGFGMEEEAVRVIQKGPKWTPAIQNGKFVNAYRRQPITFIVNEQ